MKTKRWILIWRIRVSILGLAFIVMLCAAWRPHVNATSSNQSVGEQAPNEVSQMVSYANQGRYDDAVQLGLQLLKNDPNDEIIYQQIADVYLLRAQKDVTRRDQWVSKAVSYVEKSLSLNSKDKDVAGVRLFQDARSLESAGDLSADKRCQHYDRARKLLEDRISLLEGDQITLAGRTFPLEPLRKENNRVLVGVKDKSTKAGCK
jgi:tetratricopeptide (TPR) repeat protein